MFSRVKCKQTSGGGDCSLPRAPRLQKTLNKAMHVRMAYLAANMHTHNVTLWKH
jgi:hypothetical protein